MAKWTDYTTDTNPTNTDEVMTLDADKSPKANKRVTLSTLADYFLDKLASKVFAKLETQKKTVIGALNELNSKTSGRVKVIGGIDVKGIKITVNLIETFYGVIIISTNQESQLHSIPVSPTLNTTVGQVKIETNDLTMRITFKSNYTHYACVLGGSIANGTIKEFRE